MKRLAIMLLALLPFSTFAHEGHGHTEGFTITHYIVEPEHALPLLAALVVAVVLIRRLGRKAKDVE
jgi:hypothetical protein